MGKTYTTKTSPGNFKVTTTKNPLLSQQAVTSKKISIPYTNLQQLTVELLPKYPIRLVL